MRNAQRSDGIVAGVFHKSVDFATVPQDDGMVRKQIEMGRAWVVGTVFGPKAEQLNVVRFKGTTYRRPTPKAPSKRDLWRAR